MSTTLDQPLRELIEAGLAEPYTSHSGFDGTATGNHYQSVALGDHATSGFRGDRSAVLDCIDFRGRKVLDLGSNLGEMSRSARTRGARLVDGIEYDPFFVELAQLITAYNGQSRVSFRQGDVTDPSLYEEQYDIVLALSVFHYVSCVLDELARITDVLVIETHKVHGNFDSGYLLPIQERFPAMRVLGQTDWGQLGDGSEIRLVIAFAKERAQLNELLTAPHAWSEAPSAPAPRRSERMVDPSESPIHKRFFDAWSYESASELIAAVESTEISVDALAANRDLARHGYSGWAYWFLYLKGWLHARATGQTGPGNPYYDYMTAHYVPDGADLALRRALEDPAVAQQKIERRFADLDRFEADPQGAAAETAPLRAIVGAIAPRNPLVLGDAHGGEAIPARRVDGWHRLFGARVLGVPQLRAEVVAEPRSLPLLRGVVERLSLADGRLTAQGWCLDPSAPLDAVELRRGGDTLALATPTERADVAASHPEIAHASRCGFLVEWEVRGWSADEAVRFELVGIRDWLPAGRLRIDYEPGMLDAPVPSPELTARVYGYGDPARLLLRTALGSNALLDAVGHYRLLDTFRDAVHWEAGCAVLASMAARRLPRASLTSLVADREALDWAQQANAAGRLLVAGALPPTELADGSADLVLRDRPLAALAEDALSAWLDELLRVLRPGGYVTAIAGWGADERVDMLELCGDRLDVVGATTAAAWPGGDVVVLRRP